MDEVKIKNYFFYLASLFIIIGGIKIASEIVIILFLAIFISSIISSLITLLEKNNIPKIFSYLVVIFIFNMI